MTYRNYKSNLNFFKFLYYMAESRIGKTIEVDLLLYVPDRDRSCEVTITVNGTNCQSGIWSIFLYSQAN